MSNKAHWEKVYSTKAEDEVSWFQSEATTSLKILKQINTAKSGAIIDVGGGASTFVDGLLSNGFSDITVLDLSKAALVTASQRLGNEAAAITWLETNILEAEFSENQFDVWHDRAVFHFLTEAKDRQTYVGQVAKALKPGGLVIIATFAEDGPIKCSGLPVVRYSAEQLQEVLGAPFELLFSEKESHTTPWGTVQQFVYCCFNKR